ncbi:hypothetical protein [Helicovermis profundi]|uniref:Uncharacterized protein n=1 Tax=Helicovermis profundi TaxID=3065157 RepID=A0AAU9EUN0_9FIRM|nr:hypothetical protein HLPR_11210 [Clostridia bacterium S502]
MERVVERLNLVKNEINDQIIKLTMSNKILNDICVECRDEFEIRLIESNLKDNKLIIEDSKIDLTEIDKAISVLVAITKLSDKQKNDPRLHA